MLLYPPLTVPDPNQKSHYRSPGLENFYVPNLRELAQQEENELGDVRDVSVSTSSTTLKDTASTVDALREMSSKTNTTKASLLSLLRIYSQQHQQQQNSTGVSNLNKEVSREYNDEPDYSNDPPIFDVVGGIEDIRKRK